MAVRGLDRFLDFFRDWTSSFSVIGGCACSAWCDDENVRFRSTQDIDMVLLLESKDGGFFGRFWEFIRMGGYELMRSGVDSSTRIFRFEKPAAGAAFPKKIELLTGLDGVEIPTDVKIVHLKPEDEECSLSAILLDPDYYKLVTGMRSFSKGGLPTVRMDVLPLLKAKAHLNLQNDKRDGKFVSEHDLTKHRNDVFHLAYLLQGKFGGILPDRVAEDMLSFLNIYHPGAPEWENIKGHLHAFGLPDKSPLELIDVLKNHYALR